MRIIVAAVLVALAFAGQALAQAPLDVSSLGWLVGARAHHNANGSLVYEAFIGPAAGVVTGTSVSGQGAGAYTEYHRIGPNAEGKVGLSVMNSRTNAWAFTPLKAFEKGKVVFESADGALRVSYWDKGHGIVGAMVERTANGATTKSEWSFDPLPALN